jgi:murein DD-endopeptidase MepM/ murein hydrolase activator NlpD
MYRSNGAYHGGLDFAKATGTPIRAFADGVVVVANTGCTVGNTGCGNQGGNWVKIDHQNGYFTKYLHFSQVKVKVGDKVQYGQIIGLEGNTGLSTGSHLHFEINKGDTKVDPTPYLNGTKEFPGEDIFLNTKKKSLFLWQSSLPCFLPISTSFIRHTY